MTKDESRSIVVLHRAHAPLNAMREGGDDGRPHRELLQIAPSAVDEAETAAVGIDDCGEAALRIARQLRRPSARMSAQGEAAGARERVARASREAPLEPPVG